MSPVHTTTPPGVQAAILQAVIASAHPKLALPTIAANYDLTLDQLQTLLRKHGYPDNGAMAHARQRLLHAAFDSDDSTPDAAVDQAKDDAPPKPYMTEIPVDRIRQDPQNPRDHLTDIDDLADSIKATGLMQPIVVRRAGQTLVVVAGHRRLAAVRMLRWPTVTCIVNDTIHPDDVLAAMLIENGQRVDLDPIEEARGFNTLKVQRNLSDAQVGEIVGRNQVYVSGRLALLALTPEEQAELRAGNMRLVEAAHLGRMNSGKAHHKGNATSWHLSPEHPLATRVKNRCVKLGHKRGRSVGGMGCGACWEHVIRTDERQQLHDQSARQGNCVLCGALPTTTTAGA